MEAGLGTGKHSEGEGEQFRGSGSISYTSCNLSYVCKYTQPCIRWQGEGRWAKAILSLFNPQSLK